LPKLNLKKLSLNELAALRDQVQAALVTKIASEKAALQDQIEGLAKLEGGEALKRRQRGGPNDAAAKASRPRRKIGKVAPKYRGPKGELWSGRGLPPRWLADLEAAGKKRESYLIK
jgi:DNA-binding protein H-NS